jgi:hypothetical protein
MSKVTVFTAMLALSAHVLVAAESIFFGSSQTNLETHASTPTDHFFCFFFRSAGPLTRAVLTLDRSIEDVLLTQKSQAEQAGNTSETRFTLNAAASHPHQASPTNGSAAYLPSLKAADSLDAKLASSVGADRPSPAKAHSGASNWRALIVNPSDRTTRSTRN